MTGPYAAAALLYLRAGWAPLPLPTRRKKDPPKGFTGYAGAEPDEAKVREWINNGKGNGNIAIRVPLGVVGIDVDAYGEKRGGETLAAALRTWGDLPATWRSSSRADDPVSGIRWYRCPVKLHGVVKLAADGSAVGSRDVAEGETADIEIVQHHHRYAIVAPSVHPEGRTYQWWKRDGSLRTAGDPLPHPDELPDLPEAWVEGLRADGPTAASRRSSSTGMCPTVSRELGEAVTACHGGSRHDAMLTHVGRLVRFDHQHHPGVDVALDSLRSAFVAAVAADRTGGHREAEAEYDRILDSAREAVERTPTPEADRVCRCGQRGGNDRAVPGRTGTSSGQLQERLVSVSFLSDDDEHVPPPPLPTLPPTFWESRASLLSIRQAAHSRLVAADAVLGAALTRVAAIAPPALKLPPTVGAPMTLTLITALTGPPGDGKGSASHVAEDLVPLPDWVNGPFPLGSGEGIAEAFYVTMQGPKGRLIKLRGYDNIFAFADEASVLAELGKRSGATLLSTCRSVFTGGPLGQQNATEERRRNIPFGTFSAGVLVNIQPEVCGPLFEEVNVGTPQRLVYLATIDPNTDPDAVWPATDHLMAGLNLVEPLRRNFDDIDPENPQPPPVVPPRLIAIPNSVRAEVREHRFAVVTGGVVEGDWEAHANLMRLKIAEGLGLLDGHVDMNVEDWQLAGAVKQTSDDVRDRVRDLLAAHAAAEEQSRSRRYASREVAKVAAVEDYEEARARRITVEIPEFIRDKVRAEKPGRLTVNDIRHMLHTRRRHYFDDGLAHAIAEGWVTEREEPGRRGSTRRALYPGGRS